MKIYMSACQHKGRSGGRETLVDNKKKQFLTNIINMTHRSLLIAKLFYKPHV